jgi:Carbohydrate binding domain (family 11)
MKKIVFLAAVLILAATAGCFAVDNLLLDDFEMAVSGGAEGTVDFGSGNGSSLQVSAATDIKNTGKQSLKAVYDAVAGGYMYIARGSGLDAKNATWTVKPSEIKWAEYSGISFYVYGTNSKTKIAFDVKDSGGELFRFTTEDDTAGWKKVVVSFDKFIARDDWQPQDADKNGVIDFPIKSFQFEPLPVSKGTLYFDTVELIKK